MKKKELFLIGGLILFGLIFQYIDSGDISLVRGCSTDDRSIVDRNHPHEFSDSFTFESPLKELKLDNKAGNVEIIPSDSGNILVESVLIVYHKDSSKAEKYRDMVSVTNQTDGVKGIVITSHSGEDFPYRRVRVNFKLFIPRETILDIRNRFGDIDIEGAGRMIKVDGKFGDLTVGNIPSDISVINRFGKTEIHHIDGKIEMDLKFSEAGVTDVSSIDCRIRHSTLRLSGVKNSRSVNIEGEHTKLFLTDILSDQIKIKNSHNLIDLKNVKTTDLLLTSRHCVIKADNLTSDSISIKNSYNKTRLNGVSGRQLNVLITHGDLDLSLQTLFDTVFITNTHSDITMILPSDSDPTLSLNTKYGDISNRTNLEINAVKARYLTTYSRTGTRSEININTSYGDITLKEPAH